MRRILAVRMRLFCLIICISAFPPPLILPASFRIAFLFLGYCNVLFSDISEETLYFIRPSPTRLPI